MSNKLTRKGLAFATSSLLALASLVAAVPANAEVTSVTLNPALGSTYESINQSGVAIATEVDEDTSYLKWRITSANSNYSTDEILDLISEDVLNVSITGGDGAFQFDSEDASYLSDSQFGISTEVDLQGSAVVVKAWDSSEDAGYDFDADDTAYLELWTEDDVNLDDIKLSVRAWADEDSDNNEISADEPRSSSVSVTLYDVRTITATTTVESAVVGDQLEAKTVLNKPGINTWFVSSVGSQNGAVTAAHFADNSGTLEDAWDLSGFAPDTGFDEDWNSAFATDTDNVEDGIQYNFPLVSYSDINVFLEDTSVNYSTRAWFTSEDNDDASDFVRWLGNRSSTSAVFAGSNADVDGVYGFVTDGDNVVDNEDGSVSLRDGTKSGVVTAQIVDSSAPAGEEDLAVSNVRVRATFYFNSTEEDALLTVNGVTGDAADEESLVSYGRTDAKGQVAFTYNNSNADAADEDSFVVEFEVLQSNGIWAANGLVFFWADAYVDDFTVSDDALSGSSISLTYEVVDQFGKGISAVGDDEDDVLQVTVTGLDDDEESLDKTALVPQTKSLANGAATFTFANYAAVDSFVGVAGLLHTANFDKDDFEDINDADLYEDGVGPFNDDNVEITYVHKNDATGLVDGVENDYSNLVTYAAFKDGNRDEDEALLEFTEDYGVYYEDFDDSDERESIEGSVLTANDNGAAYQAVTISGTGLYFGAYDASGDWILKTGSITTETDADGRFYFDVWSHKHNTAGVSVTITSGGKSFTTKLKTYMNGEIDEDQSWNGSEWVEAIKLTTDLYELTGNTKDGISAPKRTATYNVTAKATDVWGNVLEGANIEIDGDTLSGTIYGAGAYNEEDNSSLFGNVDTDSKGTVRFTMRADIDDYATRSVGFDLNLYVDDYNYDDGDDDVSFDFSTDVEGYGTQNVGYSGDFGPQAHAVAGAKKGAVRVHAFNVKGKSVSVFVGGKLVKTVTSDKARFLTVVKGVKAGDKRVTVKVGAKRMLSTFVSVK